jgi:outer membrane protein insertion porin family
VRTLIRAILGLWLVAVGLPSGPVAPAVAQSISAGGKIDEIVVRGTQRIEATTVESYLQVDPGDSFDPAKLNRSLKALFDTGLFADVTLTRDGGRLIVEVVENPIINRIALEGNDALKDETLRAELQLRPRVVYTRTKVQADVKRLLDVYRRNGYFGARIEPKLIEREQNRVDLVFEIDEGPETTVEAINFVGNKAFSDSTLRGEIRTSVSAWWKILSASDTYDPDRLSFDRELLRRFYLSEGYADFQVKSAVAELTPDRTGFIITFTVNEGARYKLDEVEITSAIKDLDPERLREALETETGDWYNAEDVDESINNITDLVGDLGFAFVDVKPNVERNREKQTIDLTYKVEEGPRVFVERINISGNVRTLDRVIRREFRLVEGDAFNASKLKRSRQRIEKLGFFKSVKVDNTEGSEPDKTVINVDVTEQSTGSLSFGAGFSTGAGVLGNVQLRERNLLGRAQDLQLNFSLSTQRQQIDLSFTEPYFLGRNLLAGIDLFKTETNRDDQTFDESRTGGGFRFGYEIIDRWRQNWSYEFSKRDITDVDDNAALAIQLQEGSADRSEVTHRLSYDSTNDVFAPTRGIKASVSNSFAGGIGDVRFVKNTLSLDGFYPLTDIWTLHLGGEAGHITGLGKDTRVIDRFFIGGSNVRGFAPSGLGPRDQATDDPIGAKSYYAGTVEAQFPLPLPDRFNIRGRIFTDVGAAFGVDSAPGVILDSDSPRVAIGTGASWDSPLGPIQVDLGFPIVSEDFDEQETFSFSFGTQF